MNTNQSDTPSVTANISHTKEAAIIIDWFSAGTAILELLFLSVYIIYFELILWERPITIKTFATPLNMILLMATASLCGAYVSSAIIDSMEIGTNLLPAAIFDSISEILYILFSYKRSEYILDKLYKNSFKSIKTLIFISLIIVMLAPIPGVVALFYPQALGTRALSIASKSTVIASGAVILLFDTFFCVSFIRYLRITSLEEEGDPRFRIIAKYGVMACILGYAAFAIYLSSIYATPKILSRLIEDCARAVFLFVFGTLIAMKVALNNHAVKGYLSRASVTKNNGRNSFEDEPTKGVVTTVPLGQRISSKPRTGSLGSVRLSTVCSQSQTSSFVSHPTNRDLMRASSVEMSHRKPKPSKAASKKSVRLNKQAGSSVRSSTRSVQFDDIVVDIPDRRKSEAARIVVADNLRGDHCSVNIEPGSI